MRKFVLYNRISVLIFSVFLSGLCGAFMLAYNLRSVGKRKIIAPLVIITLVADGFMFQAIKLVVSDSLLRLLIPNLIAGVILAFPVWDAYLKMDVGEFEEKAVWLPIMMAVIVYGGLYALNKFA